ncbi:50S ribosomal protein L24 [Spiroplasma endosymbiont of Labia minor]|uniref:50S ribosomal protein L24 n=1 Tax=Spiroplasma endosymbiont of Labia minor TaxID=3066305 RepID=UPI0030CB273D
MIKSRIVKGDVIKVISGSNKGHSGPVIKVSKDKTRVQIEGLNQIKHFKPTQSDSEGGIREIPKPIHISNVAVVDPKNKDLTSRVGYSITADGKHRIAKRSNSKLK